MWYINKLIDNFKKYPDRPAIVSGTKLITYQQFFENVKFYQYILSMNFSDEKECCIIGKSSPEFISMIFAVLFCGGIYVPINLNSPFKRNTDIIQTINKGIYVVLCDSYEEIYPYLAFLTNVKLIVLHHHVHQMIISIGFNGFTSCLCQDCAKSFTFKKNISLLKSKMAYIMFTSGSTGMPKGVMISHYSLNAYLKSAIDVFNFDMFSSFSQICDLGFDLSLHEILLSFISVGVLHIFDESWSLPVVKFLSESKINYGIFVPSLIPLLKMQSQFFNISLSHFKIIFLCGEVLPIDFIHELNNICTEANIVNLYGPTEATISCSYHIYSKNNNYHGLHSCPIGLPFKSVKLSTSEEGELVICGDQLFSGYYKQSLKNNLDAYYSGDLVGIKKDFGFYYIGRKDYQWQISGIRIDRSEIENAVRAVIGIDYIYAVALTRDGLVSNVVICSVDQINLKDYEFELRQNLPDKIFPLLFIKLEYIPRLSNQKIDYAKMTKIAIEFYSKDLF